MAIDVALDPNNTAAQNKAELVNALNSWTRGGEVRLPSADAPFPIDSGINWPTTRNVELVGEGSADSYGGGTAGTQLLFTSGSIGINAANFGYPDVSRPYAVIRNISINGNNVLDTGIQAGGIMSVRDCEVTKTNFAGIHATTYANSQTHEHVSTIENNGIGFLVGGQASTGTTKLKISGLKSRSNQVGLRFENCVGASVDDYTIEGNFKNGVEIYRPAIAACEMLELSHGWYENNGRDGAQYAAIHIDGPDASPRPVEVRFNNTYISAANGTAIIARRLEKGLFNWLNGPGGSVTLEAACSNTGLLDVSGNFPVTDLGSGNWQKCISDINSTPLSGYSGGWPIIPRIFISDANQTLAASDVVQKIIEIVPTSNRTLTLPSAADIITEMGGFVQDSTALLTIMNRSNDPAVTVSFIGNASTTIKGNNIVGLGSGFFMIVQESPTTVSVNNVSRN